VGVTTRPAPGRHRRPIIGAGARAVGAAIVAFVALVAITNIVFQDPTFVDRVSFVNQSSYDIRIDVTGGDGQGGMPLGVATQRCTTEFRLVIDQGSVWRIRFHAQGTEGGEVTVSRTDLERADWTFQIPDAVAADLTSRGTPPPPVQGCAPGTT